MERREIREAVHLSRATETIGRRLGDELISAAREVIKIYYSPYKSGRFQRMKAAIDRLEELVGRP